MYRIELIYTDKKPSFAYREFKNDVLNLIKQEINNNLQSFHLTFSTKVERGNIHFNDCQTGWYCFGTPLTDKEKINVFGNDKNILNKKAFKAINNEIFVIDSENKHRTVIDKDFNIVFPVNLKDIIVKNNISNTK